MKIGPGMSSNRRCEECGDLLDVNDGALCASCRPQLSPSAQRAAAQRREWREHIEQLERDAAHLEVTIRKVERRLRWRAQRR
jgi:hypothetical protein